MQGDDPPFLPVGTDVSAKYKGAFCEAKIKKVVRNIKCKVTLKTGGGSVSVNDDVIKGTLRVGNTVEVKHDPKKEAMEAVITKMQDCSQYTVVFDDGDITTLRRSALCLKSGRHFNESETLDQLPLTHPEHFSTPVIAGRRGRRGRALSEESEGERWSRGPESGEREPHVGRVVLVEVAGGAERRRPQHPAFPALVVAPTAQDTVKIKVKEDYLVRSFKDGRYYTVPKKEAREFRKGSAPLEWGGVEAALQYLNNDVLPPHWDRDALFNEPQNTSDDSSDDEPREEKDHFVAQLYKFMDDRGTPLNRNPTVANHDVDLYRLFRVVQKHGGYNRVTNQNQWKTVASKMGFQPATNSITNLCKQAYKKFLHSFEDFYRKLGVTLVAHPRGARTPPAGRSLIRDRDKQPVSLAPSTPQATPQTSREMASRSKEREKESEKNEREKSEEKNERAEREKEKEKDKSASDGEDSADNQPLATPPKLEKEKEKEKEREKERKKEEEKEKEKEKEREKEREKEKEKEKEKAEAEKERIARAQKNRTPVAVKVESHERRTPKPRRPLSSKSEGGSSVSGVRASRRPHASTDSDSSGRASRCGNIKKTQTRRSQSANSASSGNTIASNSSKRIRKRKNTDVSEKAKESDRDRRHQLLQRSRSVSCRPSSEVRAGGITAVVGDKLKVYYGPTQSQSKCGFAAQVTYEAKVIEIGSEGLLRVHYTGWNTRYDEWIKPQRIALNVTQHERTHSKKNNGGTRRSRAPRLQPDVSMQSDSESDSDSDNDNKPPPKKIDEKPPTPNSKAGPSTKDEKAGNLSRAQRIRKRPARTTSTPAVSSMIKRSRPSLATHQGRDYDLNEIRSELKGLHTVKTEPEDPIKIEVIDKESSPAEPSEEPQPEKQPEDVYEFKEPEPFEFELHDEKKKRTHRIFDDVSPTKYSSSSISKSLIEEIPEDTIRARPTLRSPSLSPFRDYSARDAVGQPPEEDSGDGLFSLDGDSFPGDSSSGPIFEGFTPAKNQETYSKKSNVSKLRELIDDSPDSPADDEHSSDDEPVDPIVKEELEVTETNTASLEDELPQKTPEQEMIKHDPEEQQVVEPEKPMSPEIEISNIISPPKVLEAEEEKQVTILEPEIVPEVEDIPVEVEVKAEEEKIEPVVKSPIIESPASPIMDIDEEEDKSEPDSPVRLDVLIPEPPPAYLLHSEGPKIAEKLLQAINSAKKRISSSPPPMEDSPTKAPKRDIVKLKQELIKPKLDSMKLSPVHDSTKLSPPTKVELIKAPVKLDPIKLNVKPDLPGVGETVFSEPTTIDIKPELEKKKEKPIVAKEPTPPRLQSPLNILERRKSVAELPLNAAGKSNKVLSDTIQKLSSQIGQSAANIPLPTFPTEDRTDSSDSDDSDRRLIIDKLSEEEWQSGTSCSEAGRVLPALAVTTLAAKTHATKSPVEWSAGESLLMLEDFCKNERKHSASVVVAGSGRPAEEDSNISILLCEETIPGSPAPDTEPAPPRARLHMPFASAPSHQHDPQPAQEEAQMEGGPEAMLVEEKEAEIGGEVDADAELEEWRGVREARHAALNTPPTTPESSLDMSPRRENLSDRDSPDRKEEEDNRRPSQDKSLLDSDKPHGGRSRKVSECSAAGVARRPRRSRRDSDGPPPSSSMPLKYNFYVELDPSWDCTMRINLLSNRLADLRKAYHNVKAELAAVDRRRKKLRRKEREAVKAAKAACS